MTANGPSQERFSLAVIEGFYGRLWSEADRLALAPFLAENGYDAFIYAPKGDASLRKSWRAPFVPEHRAFLGRLADGMRASGLAFGVGLSPFEIWRDWGPAVRADLAAKIAELDAIGTETLGILFDDMRGDTPDLAARQAEIMDAVAGASRARRIIFCPTYYSDDPVLARVFGTPPESYLEALGRRLAPAIDVFWTGPRVCSADITPDHLESVIARLGRKPFLWDNYPVNDGARMSKHLQLRAFSGRTAQNRSLLAGHAANPMNQIWLSRIPLATLGALYRGGAYDPGAAFTEAARAILGEETAAALARDLSLLQDKGLDHLSDEEREALTKTYGARRTPYAHEIMDWLDGVYAFDPACLTD
ncbi:MAG: hyaluronidase [Alphaproteobacteria bacterium]|nr:hyaluronidase [Alphaproteobacteria bacterium]